MDMVIPATTNAIFKAYPSDAVVAPYGTYVVDLTQSEEALWANLNTSHRRKVRLALKDGVEITNGINRLTLVHALVNETFQRSKMSFMDYRSFERYVGGLGEHVKVLVAERDATVQGVVVIPFSTFGAYYVYGGSCKQPVTGATNLLHWEAMRRLRELGVKRYDFVGVRMNPEKGSKQEGLRHYKQRFGGVLSEGFMWKLALKPLKFAAYSLAVRLLRGGDIVDQERRKSLKMMAAL
jgi:lipid II:glycine glycyltransferase (peptidoglycan interpeptide bridge formation enzyme)